MSEFKIKFKKARGEIGDHQNMLRNLGNAYDRVGSVNNDLDWDVSKKRQIKQRLRQCEDALQEQRNKMELLMQSLEEIFNLYESTESALCDVKLIQPEEKKWYEYTKHKGGYKIKSKDIDLLDKNSIIWTKLSNNQNIANSNGFQKAEQMRDKAKDYIKDNLTKKGTITYDSANKTFNYQDVDLDDANAVDQFDKDMQSKKLATDVKAYSVGDTFVDWSAWHVDNSTDLNTPWTLSADAAKTNVYAEAYGGLFHQDPTTGQRSFLPGIGVMAGASFSALTASAYGDFGSDLLGAYVGTTQTVGKIGANAGAQLGFSKDAQGKTNFNAYAGASAGAYLYEGTATAGVKVLGTDVGVSGSLNVGVGAHANAGFKDGVLSVDIGASLGVGGSVSLSVDVSGTVDAVCDSISNAWDEMTEWFE